MNVFLSYAVGPFDAAIPARLRAVAAAYDIAILLPDRTTIGLTPDAISKIKMSDAVIALATATAQTMFIQVLNQELIAAAQAGKPIITLIEQGMPFQPSPNMPVVYFNRSDPSAHEASLLNVLSQIRNQQQWKKDLTALGWIAGIALGLVALGALLGDEK